MKQCDNVDSNTEVLLEARTVSRIFNEGRSGEVRAVDDVSICVRRGRFVVLTGASGSGKTTLLTLLGAMDRASRGTVLFQGRDLGDCSDVELTRVRRQLAFVFQNFSLLPRLRIWENIGYPLIPRGFPSRQRRQMALEILQKLGMEGHDRKWPDQLSGGEQQRVAIARALVTSPEVLLADEPTSNLDQKSSRKVISLLEQLHDAGKTIVISTHDQELITLATEVIEMEAGRIFVE